MRLVPFVTLLFFCFACEEKPESTSEPKRTRKAKPSSSALTDSPPWRRGVKPKGKRHLTVPGDWVAKPAEANQLFAGFAPCSARWSLSSAGEDQPSTERYGVELESGDVGLFLERAAKSAVETENEEGWFWAKLPNQAPMSKQGARWQQGPLTWIAELGKVLSTHPVSVLVTVENIEGRAYERAIVMYGEDVDRSGLDKWLDDNTFEASPGDTNIFRRSRKNWRHEVRRNELNVVAAVDPPEPSRIVVPCSPVVPPPPQAGGPRPTVVLGSPGVAGGTVANASSVVARMRGRFRACYNAGLSSNPSMQGSTVLVARIGSNGEVLGVSGGGGVMAPIAGCLKAVVSSGGFSVPPGGSAVLSIPATFVLPASP